MIRLSQYPNGNILIKFAWTHDPRKGHLMTPDDALHLAGRLIHFANFPAEPEIIINEEPTDATD